SVTLDGRALTLEPGDKRRVVVISAEDSENLLTNVHLSDAIVTLEYLPTPDAKAGLFLQGRYEVALVGGNKDKLDIASPGGVQQRWDNSQNALVGGNKPIADALAVPGEWQRMEIKFRAP